MIYKKQKQRLRVHEILKDKVIYRQPLVYNPHICNHFFHARFTLKTPNLSLQHTFTTACNE